MLIATFNVNSIRTRLEIVIDWLRKRRPDVLCLQETKVEDSSFPALSFAEAGYHVVFRGEKSYNGVAIAALTRPENAHFGLDDGQEPDETRIVAAKVGPVHVVNTYVPQGRDVEHPMYRYKLQWFKRLKSYFGRHYTPRSRVVWVGDLNVAPLPIDIHNAETQANHVCYHADIRAAFEDTVDWGFVDVYRKHHAEPGRYTFYDYRTANAVKRNMGWRVDHILATRPLATKSKDASIDLEPRLRERPSDHTPLMAEFDT